MDKILFGILCGIFALPWILIGIICLGWIINVLYHWYIKKEIMVPHYAMREHPSSLCDRYYWSMSTYHWAKREPHNKKIKFYINDYLFRA